MELYLRRQHGGQHQRGLLLVPDDVCVLVHAEHAGSGGHREGLDVLEEIVAGHGVGDVVQAARIEQVLLFGEQLGRVELREDRIQSPPVPFVCHASTVIAFA